MLLVCFTSFSGHLKHNVDNQPWRAGKSIIEFDDVLSKLNIKIVRGFPSQPRLMTPDGYPLWSADPKGGSLAGTNFYPPPKTFGRGESLGVEVLPGRKTLDLGVHPPVMGVCFDGESPVVTIGFNDKSWSNDWRLGGTPNGLGTSKWPFQELKWWWISGWNGAPHFETNPHAHPVWCGYSMIFQHLLC